ncbi:stage 0 sporulation family protein [Patescibacteria group bacterium]
MKKVIGIQFRPGGKIYDFDPGKRKLKIKDFVIVSTKQGNEAGQVVYADKDVDEKMLKIPLSPIVRKASKIDMKKIKRLQEDGKEVLKAFEKKIEAHGLEMEPIDAKISFDERRLNLTFVAEGRIDFRKLVRDLASHFQKSIRLTQIGPRDRAQTTGGFGMCGRELCCTRFLKDFESITMDLAREQDMGGRGSSKITGACGRLMCCLNYEINEYRKSLKKMSQPKEKVKTPKGDGIVVGRNILEQTIDVLLDDNKAREKFKISEIKKLKKPLKIFRKK